jgi:putative FmdB family regulatory protein
MPTYEYECTGCGFRFEVFQKISDPRKESCPKCGKVVRRLIGKGAGIIFKGSGFYATDYRKPSPRAQERGKKKEEKGKDKNSSACCPSS